MSTLSTAVQDYLHLRRGLGFKLFQEGVLLPDFVSYLERQGASHITTELALRWALQTTGAPSSQGTAQRVGLPAPAPEENTAGPIMSGYMLPTYHLGGRLQIFIQGGREHVFISAR